MQNRFVPKGIGGLKTRCKNCNLHIDVHLASADVYPTCPPENSITPTHFHDEHEIKWEGSQSGGQTPGRQISNRDSKASSRQGKAEPDYSAAAAAADEPCYQDDTHPDDANDLLNEYVGLLKNEKIDLISPCPITKTDVLVVVDMQKDFLPGGNLAVTDGDLVIDNIVSLIQQASDAGATIIATRDYHPADHCSFNSEGGPFPQHAVQGTEGSQFEPSVGKALAKARKRCPEKVKIVYKGIHPDVDSYGAFTYPGDYANGRITGYEGDHNALSWTGAFELMSSNINADINAAPDVLSAMDRFPLSEVLSDTKGRLFVCGLALDYCVLDTIITASCANFSTMLCLESTRAMHISGVGEFGSGFITDPSWVAEMLQRAQAKIMY